MDYSKTVKTGKNSEMYVSAWIHNGKKFGYVQTEVTINDWDFGTTFDMSGNRQSGGSWAYFNEPTYSTSESKFVHTMGRQ